MVHTAPLSKVFKRHTNRTAAVFAVLHAVLFIASLIAIPALAPSAKFPNPFGPDEPSRHFFFENAMAIRLSDWLQLASAMCLALLGCVWPDTQEQSDTKSRTTSLIISGSLGSATFLTLSAITSWSLASPGSVDPGAAFRTFQFLPFLLGGPCWAASFAVFIAGVSRASESCVPKWMVWTGYGLSITSALATLVLITVAAAPLLPLTRFVSFLWLITAAILSNRTKQA